MPSLQYVIDTICASVTPGFCYEIIRERLGQGPFTIDDIVPAIQTGDHSLDLGSARQIAKAAVDDMAERGDVTIEGDRVSPVK